MNKLFKEKSNSINEPLIQSEKKTYKSELNYYTQD